MKIVLDTNVYIAAFLKRSLSDRVVRRCLRGDVTLYISKEILVELKRVLREKFHVPEATCRAFVRFIARIATIISPQPLTDIPQSLGDDAHLFICTAAAGADILVTFDRALLRRKHFKNVTILHPRTFLWTFPEHLPS